jgi:hypothetical protein
VVEIQDEIQNYWLLVDTDYFQTMLIFDEHEDVVVVEFVDEQNQVH